MTDLDWTRRLYELVAVEGETAVVRRVAQGPDGAQLVQELVLLGRAISPPGVRAT